MESKVDVLDNKVNEKLKFCKHCGEKIAYDAVMCVKCGRQVEELKGTAQSPNIVINNSSSSTSSSSTVIGGVAGNPKKKIVSILLCIFLGWLGAHKFYEGKPIKGIIYLFTGGLFLIGVIIDLLALLAKPSTYYV